MAGKDKGLIDKLNRIEEETTRLDSAAEKIAADTKYFDAVKREQKRKDKLTAITTREEAVALAAEAGSSSNVAATREARYTRTLPQNVQDTLAKLKDSTYWFTAGEQERKAAFTAVQQTFGDTADVPWTDAFVRHPDVALAAAVALNDGKLDAQKMRAVVNSVEILDTTINLFQANSKETREYLLKQMSPAQQASIFAFADSFANILQEAQIDADAVAERPLEWYETLLKKAGTGLGAAFNALIEINEFAQHAYRATTETFTERWSTGNFTLPSLANIAANWDETAHGQMDEASYKLLQDEYGAEFVDVIRDAKQAQYSADENAFGELVQKYANNDKALAIIDKVMFNETVFEGKELEEWKLVHELLGRTDALHKGDLGNMVANKLLPREAWGVTPSYTILDKGTNAVGVFLGDPTLLAGKGVKAYQAFRWGITNATRAGKLEKLVARPAVQRLFSDLSDDLKRLHEAAGVQQKADIRRMINTKYKKYGVSEEFIDSISPFLSAPGRKFTPTDVTDWMSQSDGLIQLMAGQPARRVPLMPHMSPARKAWIDKVVLPIGQKVDFTKDNKKFLNALFGFSDDTDLAAMTPLEQAEYLQQAGQRVVENTIRVFESPMARKGLTTRYGVVEETIRPSAFLGAGKAADDAAFQYTAGTLVGKYRHVGWSKLSVKAWRDRTDRFLRLFDNAPVGAAIRVDTAADVEIIRRWGRTTFDKHFADQLAEVWRVGNEAQRRRLANGMFLTIFEAHGLRKGLSKEIDDFIDSFMVSGSRADEIYAAPIQRPVRDINGNPVIGSDGKPLIKEFNPDDFDGYRSALHMYQTTNVIAVPNFAEVQRLSVKVGMANRLIGASWGRVAQGTTSGWNTLNLVGPRFVQRSSLEDWIGFVASGGRFADGIYGRRVARALRATQGRALSVVDDSALLNTGVGRWLLGHLDEADVAAAKLAMESGDVTTTMSVVNKALARQKTLRGLKLTFGGQDDAADAAFLQAADELPILKGKPGRASYDFVRSWVDDLISAKAPVNMMTGTGNFADETVEQVFIKRQQNVISSLVQSGKIAEDDLDDFVKAIKDATDRGISRDVPGVPSEQIRLFNEEYFRIYHGLGPNDTVRVYKASGITEGGSLEMYRGYNTLDISVAVNFLRENPGRRLVVTEIAVKDLPQAVAFRSGFVDEFAQSLNAGAVVKSFRVIDSEKSLKIAERFTTPLRREEMYPLELGAGAPRPNASYAFGSAMFNPDARFTYPKVPRPNKFKDSPEYASLSDADKARVDEAARELSLRGILISRGTGADRYLQIAGIGVRRNKLGGLTVGYSAKDIENIALLESTFNIKLAVPIKGRAFFDVEAPLLAGMDEPAKLIVAPKKGLPIGIKKTSGLTPIQQKAIEYLIKEPEGFKMMDEVAEGASNAFAPTLSQLTKTEVNARGRVSTLRKGAGNRKTIDGYETTSFFDGDTNAYMRWHGLLSRIFDGGPGVGDGRPAQIVFMSLYRIGRGQNIDKVKDKTVAKLVEYFDSDAGAVWRSRMSALSQDQSATIQQFAERYFLDTAHLLTNANGKPNRDLLRRMTQVDPETGARFASVKNMSIDDLTAVAPTSGMRPKTLVAPKYVDVDDTVGRIEHIENGVWEILGDMIGRWSREPIWAANYSTEFENLQPIVKHMTANGFEEEVAQTLVARLAMQRSTQLTLSYVDNPNVRTLLAWNVRNISRYYRATEDFYRRVVRLVKYNPESVQKGNLLYASIDHSGFVHEDDQGDKYFIYPATAPLATATAIGMQLFLGGGYGAGLSLDVKNPFQFAAKISMLTPSADPESWLPTIAAPFAAVPLKLITGIGPFENFEKILFGPKGTTISTPSGLAEEVFLSAMPAPVLRLLSALPQDEREGQYASAVKNAIAISAYNGLFDGLETEAQRNEALERIKITAMGVLGLRFILGFVLPASPQTVPYEPISDELRKMGVSSLRRGYTDLLNKYKGDAEKATATWYRLNPDLLPFTVGITETGKQKYPNLAEKSFNWMRDNKDIIKEFPLASIFAIPEGSDFSFDAYNFARAAGMIQGKDFNTMLRDVATTKDYMTYMNLKDYFDSELKLAGSSAARKEIERQWKEAKATMFLANPMLDDRVQSISEKSSPAQKRNVVEEMDRMIRFVKAERKDLYTKPLKRLASMLNLYNFTMSDIDALNGRTDTAGETARSNLRADLKATLLVYAGDNRNAKDFYDNVLEPLIGGDE